jgi:protein phosphatase
MALQEMFYKILVYGISDVGLVRQNNEDFWGQVLEDQFFVLADGMGGHQAGEVASKEAVSQLCVKFKNRSFACQRDIKACSKMIKEAIQEVNYNIYKMGKEREELKGMGTTLCCVCIHSEGIVFSHVGDSRIYRFRANRLKQITQDHSLLRELIELGQLSEHQANEFAYKNIITKAIGTEPFVEPTLQIDTIEEGDVILMCTDGLSDLLTIQDLQRTISETPEEELTKKLVKMAKLRGGHDNITAVVIKIQGKYESADLS